MTATPEAERVAAAGAALDVFEAELAVVAGVRNAAEARLVDLVVRALADGSWQGHRVHTPVQWLMWRAGVARPTAQRVVALARRAPVLPVTMAMFAEGRLSFDQAACVARYTPAEFEASVASLAEDATVAQIATATRDYGFDAQARPSDVPEPTPSEPEVPKDPEADRDMSFGTEESGQWWARLRLPLDEGLAVEGALKAVRDRLHDDARQAAKTAAIAEGRSTKGLKVPVPSWADAVVGMAHSVLSGGAAGAGVASRARILVHLEGTRSGDGWMASAHMAGVVPDELRRYLTCDADAEVVWEADGAPVNLGRTKHIVPRRIRRLIEHRDRGCRVPGCDQTWWLQIHHIVHWEDDGETVTWNLICLCSRHHRLHHKGHLGITGNADDPDGVVFTDETGRPMAGATRARPPRPADMPTVAAYQGPTGERLDPDAVFFTPTPPPRGTDPDPEGDAGDPPSHRRHDRCRHTGRPTGDRPDGARAPPVA
ncbi:DUF222 domain-containing protein [Iamia majanohamensis]|uniref:DUF222 domain-containing protein n=1 Tax=Iamia majanohamensis TaxID=467976 RepID=A0AAE9YGX9_9ACTN|nr:DUF222 domain-containing protein [Iamia majanohamensis]WCO67571.1 DUF222 domain-containing protein [Iamia majanohamensis]